MKKVLVGGTFNIVHEGHCFFFEKSKAFGDYLIVVVSSDKTAKKTKKYPVRPDFERKQEVERVDIVDKAVIGDSVDFFKVIQKEKPDVIVLGYDQKMSEKMIRKNIKKSKMKCEVVRIKDYLKGYSASKLKK